jgi:hypothetical protein
MRNVKQEKGRGTKKRKRVPTVRRERKETIQIQQYQTRRKNILTGLNQVPVAGHPIFNTLQLQRQRLSSELQRQNLDIFTPKTHVEQQMYVDLSGSIKQEIESLGQLQQSEARDLLGRVADQVKSLENQYLSAEQKLCFRRSLAGEDLWITGAGGRGKSFLLQKIIQAMKQRGLNVLQVALTGLIFYSSFFLFICFYAWTQVSRRKISMVLRCTSFSDFLWNSLRIRSNN